VTEFKKCKEGVLNVEMMCCLVVVQLCKKDPTRIKRNGKSPNQGKRAKPQQIVAQRLLSCLQYPVPKQSRLQWIYFVHLVVLFCKVSQTLAIVV
jgi:hypothetical protein